MSSTKRCCKVSHAVSVNEDVTELADDLLYSDLEIHKLYFLSSDHDALNVFL